MCDHLSDVLAVFHYRTAPTMGRDCPDYGLTCIHVFARFVLQGREGREGLAGILDLLGIHILDRPVLVRRCIHFRACRLTGQIPKLLQFGATAFPVVVHAPSHPGRTRAERGVLQEARPLAERQQRRTIPYHHTVQRDRRMWIHLFAVGRLHC